MSILQEAHNGQSITPDTERSMPDIAKSRPAVTGRIDRVGMSDIEMPIRILGPAGAVLQAPSRIDAYVSLDAKEAKGIHMSRIFLALQDHMESQVFNPSGLKQLLETFIAKHEGLSASAEIRIEFDWLRKRRALVSDRMGWRSYPVAYHAVLEQGEFKLSMETTVTYSSTCPCSAALARQLIQEQFQADVQAGLPVNAASVFEWLGRAESIRATPHSQRSEAHLQLTVKDSDSSPSLDMIIGAAEDALQTPVQAAVKREDEQAFALRNGQNLMFCEDAARRLKRCFDGVDTISGYQIRVTHKESLHPHNAEAIITG
jgi:GTP cyclohydrolase I